ncbi:hypothetical protein ANN_11179 [Periplaneta americana]|uniref:Transposase Tc1-like domain-containing protein n=1 Tax=Periplaneta americana TaxID=6978 RepID=A0ABQ8T4A9_PERAM|nr:hypothetical protein ANN_11179 [Periplaneta americana]
MSQRRQLDPVLKGRIIGRLEAGQTQTEVSRALNLTQSVISRLWRRFEDTGDVRRMPVQGRPWVTTPQEDRYLTLTAQRNRMTPERQLTSELAAASGVRVSKQTVYRRLRAGGFCARRPAVCVQLTRIHIRNRLQWSRQHQHWTLDEWRNVLFTDESRFSLTNDPRRTIIWEHGTRFHPTNIMKKRPFCGSGVLVRAGIMFNGRTDLHIFAAGTVNAQRYRDEVLERHVQLLRGAVGPHFIFMNDNAHPHRANLVDEYHEEDELQQTRTLSPLGNALRQEWKKLSAELLNHLLEGMPRRCDAYVAMRGNHTPY